MAAFDLVASMHDVALKPRMLRTLISDSVPDEKHPFKRFSDIQHIVSLIQTHKLLSESSYKTIDKKVTDNWKSAVDAWDDRLLVLVSNSMPDKCWAGICLIGVTCQECSSSRFLTSYSVWFDKLLWHIQSPADYRFMKVASCVSLSDLFTRLGGFHNTKKDGTSYAGKLIQPVLKLLNEDSSEAVWDGIIQLLCTLLTFFPSSIHRYRDVTESAIASKILLGECSDGLLQKLAHCLALLPKSRGDMGSWSLMMEKLLYMVNVHLNDVFQGLEEEDTSKVAMNFLIPQGKAPPPLLGGQTSSADEATKNSGRLLTSSVSTLMRCCCIMLTSSYPVQENVPVRSLLALVERVLIVDGSPSHTLSFMTAMQQEFICSELPTLHYYCLELLTAVIRGMGSQLFAHAALIVGVITKYFKKCVLPELRIKVYSITQILLISMGFGVAVHLAEEVISNAFTDLNQVSRERETNDAYLKVCSHKKRKHPTTTRSNEQQHHISGLEEEETLSNPTNPISLKIAALETLEALLTVAGGWKSESWRSNIDLLLITVATNSWNEECASEGNRVFLRNEPTSTWVEFRLAAFRALLASLLSPSRVRPPYLAQGLELFRQGRKETGTKLAGFCAHALLVLEVLIHPRGLPNSDFSTLNTNFLDGSDHSFRENIFSGGQRVSAPFLNGMQEMGLDVLESDDDDLYHRWKENQNGTETPATDLLDKMKYAGSETARDHHAEMLSFLSSLRANNEDNVVGGPTVTTTTADCTIIGNKDEIMTESEKCVEPMFLEPVSSNTVIVPVISNATETASQRVVPEMSVLQSAAADTKMASDEYELERKGNDFETLKLEISATNELQNESPMDSFPDLVDADPDSD